MSSTPPSLRPGHGQAMDDEEIPQTPDWMSSTQPSTAPSSIFSCRPSLDLADHSMTASFHCDSFRGECVNDGQPSSALDLEKLLDQLDIQESPVPPTSKKVRLLETIGHGTHAIIHRAMYSGDVYAAKVPNGPASEDSLRREIRVLRFIHGSSISKENIIGFDSISSVISRPLLLLELAECDLMTYITTSHPPNETGPWFEILEWMSMSKQILSGLSALHSIEVVHGDIKPQNILLAFDGSLKLADLESACMPRAEGALSSPPEIAGTTAYSAPELLRGRNPVLLPETDVFAAGVTLLVLATGSEPYSNAKSTLYRTIQAQTGDPIRYSSARHRMTPMIECYVRRCCEKQPQARWTAAEAVQRLSKDLLEA